MSEEKKVSRRGYVKYAGAGIVVVAVAGAGAYYATKPGAPTETTTTQATPTTTEGKITITGLSEVSTHAKAEDFVLRTWGERNGVNIDIQTVPWEQLIPKMMAAMMSQDPYFDLVYVSIDFMPMVVDLLEPFNDYAARFGTDMNDRNTQFGIFNEMWTVNGKLYGFSDESDPPVMHYRKDLFEDPTEMNAFQAKYGRPLTPPTNYEELIETATFFTRKKGETLAGKTLENDFYGVMLSGKANDWTISLYWACQSEFLEKGGRILAPDTLLPAFNDAIGIEATKKYTDLNLKYKVTQPDAASAEHYGMSELYRSGRTAMFFDFPILIAESYHLTNEKPWGEPPTHLVSYSVAYDKSWAMCMNKYGVNKDTTYKALDFSSSREGVTLYTTQGGVPSRQDVLNDPDIAKDRPYFAVMADIHKKARLPLAIDPKPITVSWDVLNEIATALSQVLSGQATVKDALDAAYTRAHDVMDKAGYYK